MCGRSAEQRQDGGHWHSPSYRGARVRLEYPELSTRLPMTEDPHAVELGDAVAALLPTFVRDRLAGR